MNSNVIIPINPVK